MARHLVFICHMSVDKKPLLTPLLRALLDDERFDVWIDNPDSCDPEVAGYFQKDDGSDERGIPAGMRWEDYVDSKLQDSACVLACISSSYLKRQPGFFAKLLGKKPQLDQFEREILVASSAGKLVCCRPDVIGPDDFPPNVPREQVPDLSDKATFDTRVKALCDDIARTAERASMGEAARREKERIRRETDYRRAAATLALLAGRDRQEGQIRTALSQAKNDQGLVYPLIVYGPDNELPNGFVDRLVDQSNSFAFGAWHVLALGLPDGGPGYDAEYRARLEGLLGETSASRPGAAVAALPARLTAIGKPLCIVHQIDAASWYANSADRVRNWLRVWKALAHEAPTAPFVPLLCLTLPEAHPGWHRPDVEDQIPPGPPTGRGIGNAAIRDALRALVAEAAAGQIPDFGLTQILPPLYREDALNWSRAQRTVISQRLSLDDLAVEERIGKLFADCRIEPGYNPAIDGLNCRQFRNAFVDSGQGRGA